MPRSQSVSVFLRGGLGNQLFQYASGLWLSQLQERRLVIRDDLLPAHEDKINGISRWPNQISEFNHSGRIWHRNNQPPNATNLLGKTMQLMRLMGDISPRLVKSLGWMSYEHRAITGNEWPERVRVINGYCMEKAIARSARQQLRVQLNEVRSPSVPFMDLLQEIAKEPIVAVHVRQGDYLSLESVYGKLGAVYFSKALEQIDAVEKRVWIFTDSPKSLPAELIDLIKPDRVLGPLQISRAIENLVLMSHAKAIVASNSTFSWWAGCISAEETELFAPYLRSAKVNNFDFEFDARHNWNLIPA